MAGYQTFYGGVYGMTENKKFGSKVADSKVEIAPSCSLNLDISLSQQNVIDVPCILQIRNLALQLSSILRIPVLTNRGI